MIIHSAKYLASYPSISKCPNGNTPEYAFIGRSNVGKSSLINLLTNHKKLAKTSSTPGKTQMINYFEINEAWYLVDLPGYGYAKVSKKHRESFQKMIRGYLANREQLIMTFVLVDSRIKPQQIDIDFINWLGSKSIPFGIIFTKADKANSQKIIDNIASFNKKLTETWESLPPSFKTSIRTAVGRDELLEYIDGINLDIQSK